MSEKRKWRYQQRCEKCGRWFRSENPYDDTCSLTCYHNLRYERLEIARLLNRVESPRS